MTVTVAPPFFYYLPNNNNIGGPAAGFKLFTYIAGTSTKQATWVDSTQTTTNANPILLDANGFIAAASGQGIWLDPTLNYKFVLALPTDTDPPTSPIRTMDNVQGNINVSTLTAGLLGPIYGTDSGAVNAYVFTHYGTVPSGLTAGSLIRFTPLNTNNGAATLNADGTGAVAIIRANGSALTGGELSSLGPVVLQSTGTQWQIVVTAGAQPGYERTAAEIAAAVTPTNYSYPPGNVLRYGADPLGVSNSVTAFNAATAANTSFCVVPPGTYLLNSNTNIGLWQVSSGVTFTGAGTILGKYIRNFGAAGAFIQQLVSNFETPTQLIGFDVEQGLYQTGTVSALQFGQTTEVFTPSASTTIWSGQINGTYGSVSHFGSGALTSAFGGAFEAFNSGSATANLIQGVNGNAWNGGVAAGIPVQSPTNNGNATNMRGVAGFCSNLSTGTVTSAQSIYASTITNTGGGTITTAVGVTVADQTAGVSNYGVRTGLGQNYFGDCLRVAGSTNLPAATGGQFFMSGGFASPSNGRIYVGDGSGWRIEFAKRTGSTDTVLASITDSGALGVNGNTPPAQVTGFGTPTGTGVIANFPGATATLAQCSQAIAQIIKDLKAIGFYGT